MEIYQLICLALWMASSIVNASNNVAKVSTADVIFYSYEFQVNLAVEDIQNREPSKNNLKDKLKVISEAVENLSDGLLILIKADIGNGSQSNSTQSTINVIAEEILKYRQINNGFRLPALVKSLESTIGDDGISEKNAANAEQILVEMIDTFANRDSPIFKYPSLAIPTLNSLASFVETFIQILNKQNNTLASETRVACDLSVAILDYFKPALIDRFMNIDINTDYQRFMKNNKYVFSEKISNQPFYLNRYKDFIRCILIEGGKQQYLEEKAMFKKTKTYKPQILNLMDPNMYIESVNTDKFNVSTLKDSLGGVDEYFYDYEVEYGTCALDYFSLVRQRLESEFGEAFDNVERVCKSNISKKQPTGFGWLTIQVGAVLAERLVDGAACDLKQIPYDKQPYTILNTFCEPYVKMTVNYEIDGKPATLEHKTEFKQHAAGWTTFDELFHFDKIPKNASIDIKILNRNHRLIFSETMNVSELLGRILFQNSYSKLFMISTWRNENSLI